MSVVLPTSVLNMAQNVVASSSSSSSGGGVDQTGAHSVAATVDGYNVVRDGSADPASGPSQPRSTKSNDFTTLLLKLLMSNGAKDNAMANSTSLGFNNTNQFDFGPMKHTLSIEEIVALILGIIGVLANLSSLIAISRTRNSLTANLRLIVSLCASDMLVSTSILMQVSYEAFASLSNFNCTELILRGFLMTSHVISLLNLLGLALDHYFAILKPLNYPTLMCKQRANIMIIVFWIVSLICGFSDFIIPTEMFSFCKKQTLENYCDVVFCTMYREEYIVFAMSFVSIILMSVLYATIFVQIRRYQSFQQQYRQNMKRNRRGLVTTFVIVFAFMITWLPYCLFEVTIVILNKRFPANASYYLTVTKKCDYYLYDILLLNSLFDPLIYAMRMREVQNGYWNILEKCSSGRRSFRRGVHSDRRFGSSHASMSTSIYNRQSQSESYL